SRLRDFVDLDQRCLRRIRPKLQAHDVPGEARIRPPDGPISWTIGDAVEPEPAPLVLAGIVRLVGLYIGIPLTVAVGIDDERRPALRPSRVTGLPEQLGVDPADDGQLVLGVVTEPQRVIRILAEI